MNEKIRSKIVDIYDQNDHNLDQMNEWVCYKDLFSTTTIEKLSKNLCPSNNDVNSKNLYPLLITPIFRKYWKNKINKCNRFLIGLNTLTNQIAITLVEETRRVTHKRCNSFATILR